MTPLQQAAQAVIAKWDKPLAPEFLGTGIYMSALREALEAEQAQAVEPVATTMADHIKNECGYVKFNAVVPNDTKLFTRPAPTPNGTIGNGSHRLVELDLLGAIAGALNRSKNAPNILEKVRGLIKQGGGVGRGLDAPYPGMIEAFEAHYGQSFTDKDWRNEAGIWAASWGCAVRQSPTPAGEHVPESCFGNTERAELIKALRDHYAFPCYPHGPEILAAANMLQADASLADKRVAAIAADRDYWREQAKQVAAPYDQQALELCDACGWKAIMPGEPCFVCNMKTEAQQVAVPMTNDQIEAACRFIEPSLDGPIAYDLLIARAIEAHHGIGEKK